MLGRYQQNLTGDVSFAEIRQPLADLIEEFGPAVNGRPDVVNPFWRLQNDKEGRIWRVTTGKGMRVADTVMPPPIGRLVEANACANFAPELARILISESAYVARLAGRLLATHFPASLHDDIREAAKLIRVLSDPSPDMLDEEFTRPRDPGFRDRVLLAYEYRCAVTGWDMRLRNMTAGLEAAHIRWHVNGGPSDEPNGLALNSLHHKLFDLGAFTLSLDKVPRVMVSRLAVGGGAVKSMLLDWHGKPIQEPQDKRWLPDPNHIQWHQQEVFKGEARAL